MAGKVEKLSVPALPMATQQLLTTATALNRAMPIFLKLPL
jgi:hypothetical protein